MSKRDIRLFHKDSLSAVKKVRVFVFEKTFDAFQENDLFMDGEACMRGMRIPIPVIVDQIANGAATKEIFTSTGKLDATIRDNQVEP